MSRAWVRSVRAQCRAADVAFFFKQWGGVRKSIKGRLLDGRLYDEMPDRLARPDSRPSQASLALADRIRTDWQGQSAR